MRRRISATAGAPGTTWADGVVLACTLKSSSTVMTIKATVFDAFSPWRRAMRLLNTLAG